MKKKRKVNSWRSGNYNSPEYQESLDKYKKSMHDMHKRKLEKLDKTPPLELIKNRKKND